VRTTGAWLVAGMLVGLAALHRPIDAVLAVAPVVGYLAWMLRREFLRPRVSGAVAVGAAPFAALLLAYNATVMGSPLRFAFGVTGRQDTFLFGWRASYLTPGTEHADEIHYTLGRALSTLGHDLALMPRFVALAPLVLCFAGTAIWSRRRDPRCWLLLAMVAAVIGGYVLWWGTANAQLFGIDRALGPFYDYAALAPLCVLGAWGVTSVRLRARWLVGLALVALIWGAAASWNVLSFARQEGRIRSADVRLTEPPSAQPTLVLVPPVYPGDPYLRYASDDLLAGRRLVALDVAGRRLELVSRYPDRVWFLVRDFRRYGNAFGPTLRDRVRLTVVRGAALSLKLRAIVTSARAGSTYLRIGGRPAVIASSGSGQLQAAWTITPAMVASHTAINIAIGVTVAAPGAPAPRTVTQEWYECRFEARVTGNQIEALAPCDGWHHYEFPNGQTALSHEDLSQILDITLTARPTNSPTTHP